MNAILQLPQIPDLPMMNLFGFGDKGGKAALPLKFIRLTFLGIISALSLFIEIRHRAVNSVSLSPFSGAHYGLRSVSGTTPCYDYGTRKSESK
jgi:hypothetical protein